MFRRLEGEPTSVIMTKPPVLNVRLAVFSRDVAKRFMEIEMGRDFKAAELGIALAAYNNQLPYVIQEINPVIIAEWQTLVQNEQQALAQDSLLVPAGFEIETGVKPFKNTGNAQLYASFFDNIGMPRNKVNSNVTLSSPSYWEFSPPPSASIYVQKYILRQLVEGRFIPTLIAPLDIALSQNQSAQLIKEMLSDRLLSLHVNMAIPTWMADLGMNAVKRFYANEFDLLSAAFGLAFTSAARLMGRHNPEFHRVRDGAQYIKTGYRHLRLEIILLELAGVETFEMMDTLQLIVSSMFQYLHNRNSKVGFPWRVIKTDLKKTLQSVFKLDEYERKNELALLKLDLEKVNQAQQLLRQCATEFQQFL